MGCVRGRSSGAVLEAPALVAGLDDVAVVGEPVEQRGGHLCVAGLKADATYGWTRGSNGMDGVRKLQSLKCKAMAIRDQIPYWRRVDRVDDLERPLRAIDRITQTR